MGSHPSYSLLKANLRRQNRCSCTDISILPIWWQGSTTFIPGDERETTTQNITNGGGAELGTPYSTEASCPYYNAAYERETAVPLWAFERKFSCNNSPVRRSCLNIRCYFTSIHNAAPDFLIVRPFVSSSAIKAKLSVRNVHLYLAKTVRPQWDIG